MSAQIGYKIGYKIGNKLGIQLGNKISVKIDPQLGVGRSSVYTLALYINYSRQVKRGLS